MLEMIVTVLFGIVKIIGLTVLGCAGLLVVAILAKILIEIIRYKYND